MPKPNIFEPNTWDKYNDEIKVRLWAIKEMLEPEQEFLNEVDWECDF